MNAEYRFELPREPRSIGMVRRLSRETFREMRVASDCSDAITLALTEACTNVVRHAGDHVEKYQVTMKIDESECDMAVIDGGLGIAETPADSDVDLSVPVGGWGMPMMRMLVDEVEFTTRVGCGTVVRMSKRLTYQSETSSTS